MTQEEKWWKRFCKVMDDMPETIEILINAYGKIAVAKRGASNRYFKEHGHVDNVERLDEFHEWRGDGVENNGSSL